MEARESFTSLHHPATITGPATITIPNSHVDNAQNDPVASAHD